MIRSALRHAIQALEEGKDYQGEVLDVIAECRDALTVTDASLKEVESVMRALRDMKLLQKSGRLETVLNNLIAVNKKDRWDAEIQKRVERRFRKVGSHRHRAMR